MKAEKLIPILCIAVILILAVADAYLLPEPNKEVIEAGGDLPASEPPAQGLAAEETEQGLAAEETERIRQLAVNELAKWRELGIISAELSLDGDSVKIFETPESELGEEYLGRVMGKNYTVSSSCDGYSVYVHIDRATEKIVYASIAAFAGEGDEPLPDREPITPEGSDTPCYYYDKFSDIFPEDITLDELCTRLNEYWGFSGYTISGTKYAPYGYDTEAPAGSSPVKSLTDSPFLTVYFDGDQAGAPMYVDIINCPLHTIAMIGTTHAVG